MRMHFCHMLSAHEERLRRRSTEMPVALKTSVRIPRPRRRSPAMTFPEEWIKLAPKPKPLAGTDKWNVFLSYRSVNRSWVLNLYDVLREQGHQVFLDQCVLKAGDELEARLGDALELSQAGILVWSESTRDSDWVRAEYQRMSGLAKKKKDFQFVPVKLDK